MSNQASEDELQTAVNRCFIPHDDHSWPCVGCKSTRDNIVNLIRTEKLKLLSEVREQAGEYELNMHGFYDKDVSDKITAVPLEALTKLDAEL